MEAALELYNAKINSSKSDTWAAWAHDNPEAAKRLAKVEKLVNDG